MTDKILNCKLSCTHENGDVQQVFFQVSESAFLTIPEDEFIDRYIKPSLAGLRNLYKHPETAQSSWYKGNNFNSAEEGDGVDVSEKQDIG